MTHPHPDPLKWRANLDAYRRAHHPRSPLPDGHMLDGLAQWQRRITGGTLLDFLKYITSEAAFERYPVLGRDPLTERVFVGVVDVPGAVAFHELVDAHGERAICLLRHEWRDYLGSVGQDHDDAFASHYELWSFWHRDLNPLWELPGERPGQQLWVHEEGFALAHEVGRGSQHIWSWDGQQMTLVEQDINKWVY